MHLYAFSPSFPSVHKCSNSHFKDTKLDVNLYYPFSYPVTKANIIVNVLLVGSVLCSHHNKQCDESNPLIVSSAYDDLRAHLQTIL